MPLTAQNPVVITIDAATYFWSINLLTTPLAAGGLGITGFLTLQRAQLNATTGVYTVDPTPGSQVQKAVNIATFATDYGLDPALIDPMIQTAWNALNTLVDTVNQSLKWV